MITGEKTKTEITVEGLKGLGFKECKYSGVSYFNYDLTDNFTVSFLSSSFYINVFYKNIGTELYFSSLEDIQTFINFFKKQNEKN